MRAAASAASTSGKQLLPLRYVAGGAAASPDVQFANAKRDIEYLWFLLLIYIVRGSLWVAVDTRESGIVVTESQIDSHSTSLGREIDYFGAQADWHCSRNANMYMAIAFANLPDNPSESTHTSTDSAPRDIITQIRIAARNPLPAIIGALLGALVPSATFVVGHCELTSWTEPKALIVLGGLVFSALTVFRWGRLAFGSAVKALGFVVLAEGVMTFCSTEWLSVLALGYLVLINAIATGCTIALGAIEHQKSAAPTAVPVATPAVDASAQLMAAVARLESRIVAREIAPLVLQPTKGTRKRSLRKSNTRQLHIIPENSEVPGDGGGPLAALPSRRVTAGSV